MIVTNMAGRVERRINNKDKFYFVLDEVGGSSDVESESLSDNESKLTNKKTLSEVGTILAEKMKERSSLESTETIGPEKKNAASISEDKSTPDSDSEFSRESALSIPKKNPRQDLKIDCKSSNRDFAESTTCTKVIDMDVDSDSCSDETERSSKKRKLEPLMTITFRDNATEKLYKSSLVKHLGQKIHPCTVVTNSENNLEIEVYQREPEKIVEDVLDFSVDTTPDYNSRTCRIPYYAKTGSAVLSDKVSEKQNGGKHSPFNLMCFNCTGNHNIKNCPKPRDYVAINRNRSKFLSSNKISKTSRYHLDDNQKYGHFQPGDLSKNLRNALNLHHDQLPMFYYRMRLLGYPPGWLEEARVSHSGVALYDSKGVPVLEEDEEEGEIISERAKDRFDITKIIEFPGFNIPVPKNYVDEGRSYTCPPISEEQSKESMIRKLEPNAVQAYKKKSLTTGKTSPVSDIATPSETPRKMTSPTIEEMEEKKRQLIMALKDEDTTSDTKLSQEDSCSLSQGTDSESTPKARDFGTIKNLDFGTPILKSVSTFSKLPNREKFSVNVSDVINFENLPNSTGKYETMTHIITKIRHTVSKTQSE